MLIIPKISLWGYIPGNRVNVNWITGFDAKEFPLNSLLTIYSRNINLKKRALLYRKEKHNRY